MFIILAFAVQLLAVLFITFGRHPHAIFCTIISLLLAMGVLAGHLHPLKGVML